MTTRPADTASTGDHIAVVYPESDGVPLPDGHFQDPLFREIVSTLEAHFKDSPNTTVSGNTFIYYREGDPRRWVSPDCYIAFDISMESIERFNTYRVWEVGKPPDFALEIGSPSTARTDLVDKRELYAELGIPEYWRYDATGGDFYGESLVGERLVEGEYRRIELDREPGGMVWGHSPQLGLDLCWDAGRLRFYDPVAGRWLLNQMETEARAESAESRADAAEAHADAAEAHADAAESRADAAESRADAERAARESAEALLAAMEAELRRLRGG